MEQAKELRKETVETLQDRLKKQQEAHHQLMLAHGVAPVEQTSKIKKSRRAIARLKTIIVEKTTKVS